jgi:hypothetical protein
MVRGVKLKQENPLKNYKNSLISTKKASSAC